MDSNSWIHTIFWSPFRQDLAGISHIHYSFIEKQGNFIRKETAGNGYYYCNDVVNTTE